MTMKMIISTSRISMSGTTLGVAIAPPFSPPTSIPIASLLVACALAFQQAVKPRRVGSGAAAENQQTNGATVTTVLNPPAAEELLSPSGSSRWSPYHYKHQP